MQVPATGNGKEHKMPQKKSPRQGRVLTMSSFEVSYGNSTTGESNMKVRVVPYNPVWKLEFEREADSIAEILGDLLVSIHHIGSTAVEGLCAKPIIDIMPVVTDVEKVDDFDESFRKSGYECMGEFGIPGRRYYRKGGDDRTHQIHIFGMTDKENIERHLAVRDYLRKHAEVAERYGALKKHLAQKFPLDIEGYCEGKDAFVKAMEIDALRWKMLIGEYRK